MWTPADLSTVRTRSDLKHAKEAVNALEHKLQKARRVASTDQPELQDLIAGMVKDLEKRKAWFSPIRILTFDTLSLVFELTSQVDWRAPVRIGAVCRTWRSAVLATPRAWTNIHLEMVSEHQRNLFLERSGQVLLQVLLGSEDYAGITNMAYRIHCMETESLPPIGEHVYFPNLTCMRLGSARGSTDIRQLTKQRFPALRNLVANTFFVRDSGIPSSPRPASFPPIQSLGLLVHRSLAWLDVLQECKESLTEIVILFYLFEDTWSLSGNPIHMPRLKYLDIKNASFNIGKPLKLTTPALRVYIETGAYGVPSGVVAEMNGATHMRIQNILLLSQAKNLKVLQVTIWLQRLESLFEQLRPVDHCANLQVLEIDVRPRASALERIKIVESWKEINRPNVDFHIVNRDWKVEFSDPLCVTQTLFQRLG